MPISLVDQQISNDISSLLQGILSNVYIINRDILREFPKDISDSFLATYGIGDNYKGINIPIYFAFPDTVPTNAFLLVQYEGGEEDTDHNSLGLVSGVRQPNSSSDIIHERLKVQVDSTGTNPVAYLSPSKDISSIISIVQTTKHTVKDNKIYLTYFDVYANSDIYMDVYYSYLDPYEGFNTPIGIVMNEKVTVDIISSNVNTVRCLSAIMSYISIYLKTKLENNGNVFLPQITFNGMDLIDAINSGENSIAGQQLRYRRMGITYKTIQTIGINSTNTISDINMNKGDLNIDGNH